MAILEPDDLLDQADALRRDAGRGHRTEADLRRAISTTYYSVFHLIVGAAADRVVGLEQRARPLHTLVYRAIDHRGLSAMCLLVSRPRLPPKYRACCPAAGFGDDIRVFGRPVYALQQRRNAADHDPGQEISLASTDLALRDARAAIQHWRAAPEGEREALLLLLLFPPR